MITSAILGTFLGMLYKIVDLFPSSTELPFEVNDWFTNIATYLHSAQGLFPVGELVAALGIMGMVEVAIWGIVMVLFIYRRIRSG
jgi:hypothetical protein